MDIARKSLLCLIVSMVVVCQAKAIPAYGREAKVKQPDGSMVTIRLHGDEYLSYNTTQDGYTVMKDNEGFFVYAELRNGLLQPTAYKAHDPAMRQADEHDFLRGVRKHLAPNMKPAAREEKARESTRRIQARRNIMKRGAGYDYRNFRGLIILVEYNDRSFSRSNYATIINDIANQKNYKGFQSGDEFTGSVRDYFSDMSGGLFNPEFDVIGPVKIDHSQYFPEKTDHAAELMYDVVNAADKLVDFRKYDGDNDGVADLVYFIFAGVGSNIAGNDARLLWPHAGEMYNPKNYYPIKKDNIFLRRYACSTELLGSESSNCIDGIGTICHEFSHVLGLADHYDTDYEESGGESIHPGVWDIMAGGCYLNNSRTPVGYNAFESSILGFTTPKPLDVEGTYNLKPFDTSAECYLLHTGTANEDFYIENRQQQGWDLFLPGHGMLVWRVDLSDLDAWMSNKVNTNPTDTHFELFNAMPSMDILSEYTPFPGKGNVIDLTTSSMPALVSSEGKDAAFSLYDITETPERNITFNASNTQTYEYITENFETMSTTTDDAENLPGAFCNWNLTNAVIEPVHNNQGTGEKILKLMRNGYIETTLPTSVHNISFSVWNENYNSRISIKYRRSPNDSWIALTNSSGNTVEIINKNTTATITCHSTVAQGCQLMIMMQSVYTSAAAYIDDILFTIKENSIDGVDSIPTEAPRTSRSYSLSGQKVDSHYRGIIIRDGKKTITNNQ